MGARSWCERRSQASSPQHEQQQRQEGEGDHLNEEDSTRRPPPGAAPPQPGPPPPPSSPHSPLEPITSHHTIIDLKRPPKTISPHLPSDSSVMYTDRTVKERQQLERDLLRDRQVRLQSVQTDILLDLPPAIALPDGEEHRLHSCKLRDAGSTYASLQLIHLRDPEQESEIYRGYIRPPPNRTVPERGGNLYPHHPPPYTQSSRGGGASAYNRHHNHAPSSRFGNCFSLRTSSVSVDSDMVALLSASDSYSSLDDCTNKRHHHQSSQRYARPPPSYASAAMASYGETASNACTKNVSDTTPRLTEYKGNKTRTLSIGDTIEYKGLRPPYVGVRKLVDISSGSSVGCTAKNKLQDSQRLTDENAHSVLNPGDAIEYKGPPSSYIGCSVNSSIGKLVDISSGGHNENAPKLRENTDWTLSLGNDIEYKGLPPTYDGCSTSTPNSGEDVSRGGRVICTTKEEHSSNFSESLGGGIEYKSLPPSYVGCSSASSNENSSGVRMGLGSFTKNNQGQRDLSEGTRTLTSTDEGGMGACLRVAAIPREAYDGVDQYSESPPPSYNDIVGTRELDKTNLVSRQQSNEV